MTTMAIFSGLKVVRAAVTLRSFRKGVRKGGGLVREYAPSALNSGLGIIGICRIILYIHYIHTLTMTRAASGLRIPYNQINQAI